MGRKGMDGRRRISREKGREGKERGDGREGWKGRIPREEGKEKEEGKGGWEYGGEEEE